ncbi:MAG TPA: hypothetical protein VNF24_00580 [Candidatus Acidoferrales bacterium]|nr:hypothetical protein [Candidatus Acidoferrales bacterium]HVC23610.1 hypothetical protein [Candidatus Dormibacteraeota bacterium]
MKPLYGLVLVVVAGAAIEKFYHHPTYGNGLSAFMAAFQAGEFFA